MSITIDKGRLGELKAELRAEEKGWVFSKPVKPVGYDAVLDDGTNLYRAQIKYAGAKTQKGSGSVYCTADNGPSGTRIFSKDKIDVVLVYVPTADKMVWVGPEHFDQKAAIYIRLETPKNKQAKRIFSLEENEW